MSRFMPDDTTLTPAQEQLVAAMLSAPTVRDAAKKCRIAERTAWNYLALPQVKVALQQGREEIRQQAIDLLQSQTLQSVQTLVTLRDDEEVPAPHRLKAAQLILELAMRSTVVADDEYHAYDLREFLGRLTPEQLEIVKPLLAEASAKKAAEQESTNNIHSMQRVG